MHCSSLPSLGGSGARSTGWVETFAGFVPLDNAVLGFAVACVWWLLVCGFPGEGGAVGCAVGALALLPRMCFSDSPLSDCDDS